MPTANASIFVCPATGDPLAFEQDGVPGQPALLVSPSGRRYPVKDGVARFVPDDVYASNFGMQWNTFSRTQLDRYNGTTISRDRFRLVTGWSLEDLAGKRVLDAGCGAGRFAQIALDAGAEVVAVDLSSAVDACQANLGPHPRLTVVQASIYDLPFSPGSFDFVYSIGVLQHTPDVERAVKALPP
ncbi:MAG: class I SAM-dependent methyltransferase, partial [bacterium]